MSKGNRRSSRPAILENLRRVETIVRYCIDEIEGYANTPQRSASTKGKKRAVAKPKVDFESNERHFVRTHAVSLSGRKKFALLTAFLAKGEVGKEVPLKDIEAMWSRMTAPLGGPFNRKYSNDAKESGWVDTKKKGLYSLRPKWQDILR